MGSHACTFLWFAASGRVIPWLKLPVSGRRCRSRIGVLQIFGNAQSGSSKVLHQRQRAEWEGDRPTRSRGELALDQHR